jgi:hypothetical protein
MKDKRKWVIFIGFDTVKIKWNRKVINFVIIRLLINQIECILKGIKVILIKVKKKRKIISYDRSFQRDWFQREIEGEARVKAILTIGLPG